MRYLPLSDADRQAMLRAIGVADMDALYRDVPVSARLAGPVDMPGAQGEMEVERALNRMAMKNLAAGCAPFFLGAGAYRHHIPAAIDHLVQRGEFLTSYTPYQPEITQGTLQYLFEFQTQVCALTGMEVANASLYDGASACAEALTMAARITGRKKAVLSGGLHPHWRETTRTQARFLDIAVKTLPPDPAAAEDMAAQVDGETACAIVQNPGFFGQVRDLTALAETCHKAGALLVVAVTEPVSLGLLTPPGAMGADIVVGEGQSLGGGLNFGGPYLGLFATRGKFVRQMPGRLVGQTIDVDGRRGWVLTLSTREQHIRREKATSNICTNSGLCALAFSMHVTFLGEAGMTRLARLNHAKAVQLAEKLGAVKGVSLINDTFFNEFTLRLGKPAAPAVEAMAKKGVLGGVPASRLCPGLDDLLLVCATETATDEDMDALVRALTEAVA